VSWTFQQLQRWGIHSGTPIVNEVRSLPKANQQRLLLAPAVFALLRRTDQPDSGDLETLRCFIAAERRLLSVDSQPKSALWTALGDAYLAGDEDSADAPVKHGYRAPLAGTIVLDPWSPHYDGTYPSAFGNVVKHQPEEVEPIFERIRSSLKLIGELSATAARTVCTTHVIVLAKTPDVPALMSALSRRSIMGNIALMNGHLPLWTRGRIADSLVHESIHSTLYKLELDHDFYTDDRQAHVVQAISPWSGRTLFLHSFVHGCFVWFGLWNLWKQAPEGGEDRAVWRDRALNGFLKGNPLDGVSREANELIDPAIKDCIGNMYTRVMSDARQQRPADVDRPSGS